MNYSDRCLSQRKDVVNALHASSKPESWVECGGQAGKQFNSKLSLSSITLLPSLLEGFRYSYLQATRTICNYMGLESMIKSMTWNGEKRLGVCDCSCTSMLDHLTSLYIEGTYNEAVERE